MRKIVASLALLLATAASPAWADAVISALGSAGAVSASDIIPDCQSCSASSPMVGMTITQLDTYLDTLFLQKANNLSDLANAGTARTNLGLGSLATLSVLPLANLGGAVNGDCIVGSGGVWTAASCGSGGSVSITAGNAGIVFSPSPLTGTGTASLNITGASPTSHQWIASMTAAGVATLSQPAFTDLSGAASVAQIATALTTPGPIGGTTPGTGSFSTLTDTGITGLTQCLHVNSSGLVSGTGSDCGSGGSGTPVVFTGTTAGSANAQTIASPTPSGYALNDQYEVLLKVGSGLTNTGATTLNVNGTGALAVAAQSDGGLSALVGGELQAGLQYNLSYQASCPSPISANCYVIKTVIASGVTQPATSTTVTAPQWKDSHVFAVVASGQNFTLPAANTLSPIGGVVFSNPAGLTFTITPAGSDGINGGSAGTAVVLGAGLFMATTTGSTGTAAIAVGGGSRKLPFALSWAPGQNLSTAAIPLANLTNEKGWVIAAITCTPEVAVGGTATFDVYEAPSGTALGSGTKLNTTSCNANGTVATDQNMAITTASITAGDRIGIVATGGGWSSSAGSGVVTVTVYQ